MNIRPEQPADLSQIDRIHALAFGRNHESILVEKIRNSPYYIPELSIVAEIDGFPVGHILFSYIHLVGDRNLQVLALAPVAVKPEYQKQGIGSALIKEGLRIAQTREEHLVTVLGEPSFYSRFGFESSQLYGIECPFPLPAEVFMIMPLKNYHASDRGKIVYPPAFNEV